MPKGRRLRFRPWRFLAWLLGIILLGPLVMLAIYRVVPPPGTPLMLLRAIEGEAWHYRFVPLQQIAPALPQSVVAAEDNLFCQHAGFDYKALREQADAAAKGEVARGASTISMQLARNLFLWPGRSFVRKGLELWLTAYLELMLPKRRIMELYLNVVEWGPGIYGAGEAARLHFGVAPSQLTPVQAAQLAAVLPNPRRWSASRPTPYIRQRAEIYRQRIPQLGPALIECWK